MFLSCLIYHTVIYHTVTMQYYVMWGWLDEHVGAC